MSEYFRKQLQKQLECITAHIPCAFPSAFILLSLPAICWPVIAVLDVEEQERPCHEHAQDGDGGEDAVEGHVDVAPL